MQQMTGFESILAGLGFSVDGQFLSYSHSDSVSLTWMTYCSGEWPVAVPFHGSLEYLCLKEPDSEGSFEHGCSVLSRIAGELGSRCPCAVSRLLFSFRNVVELRSLGF